MKLELTRSQERRIRHWITLGRYASPDEVVRAALLQLDANEASRDDRLASLREALANGLAQANRGELLDGAAVVREARATLRSRGIKKRRKQ